MITHHDEWTVAPRRMISEGITTTVYGKVVQVPEGCGWFLLEYGDHRGDVRRLRIDCPERFRTDVLRAHRDTRMYSVAITGTGFLDDGILTAMAVDGLEVTDVLDIRTRIEELVRLEPGWSGDDDEAPLDCDLLREFASLYTRDMPPPPADPMCSPPRMGDCRCSGTVHMRSSTSTCRGCVPVSCTPTTHGWTSGNRHPGKSSSTRWSVVRLTGIIGSTPVLRIVPSIFYDSLSVNHRVFPQTRGG